VAVGAETLSEGNERLNRPFVDEIMNSNQDARDCMLPMGKPPHPYQSRENTKQTNAIKAAPRRT
jgi:hypothetical protein